MKEINLNKLNDDNKQYLTSVMSYIDDIQFSEDKIKMVKKDIYEMIIEAQNRGQSASAIFGDPKMFSQSVTESLPLLITKNILLKKLGVMMLVASSLIVSTVLINSFINKTFLVKSPIYAKNIFLIIIVSLISVLIKWSTLAKTDKKLFNPLNIGLFLSMIILIGVPLIFGNEILFMASFSIMFFTGLILFLVGYLIYKSADK